jgi:hypothetical protein
MTAVPAAARALAAVRCRKSCRCTRALSTRLRKKAGVGTHTEACRFRLTDSEAAQLQAVFAPGARVGLAATANNATGGFETFFVANTSTSVTPIPEPDTYALMLGGLGAVGLLARRRRQRRH